MTGIIDNIKGCFTIYKYIKSLDRKDLERTLGFHHGRLDAGFKLVVLAPGYILNINDFDLDSSTRWSGGKIGKHKDSIDSLLFARGIQQEDINKLKNMVVERWFSKGGDYSPAKVLPNLLHEDWMKYPNAEALGLGIPSGVPQFLLKKNSYPFLVVKEEGGLLSYKK